MKTTATKFLLATALTLQFAASTYAASPTLTCTIENPLDPASGTPLSYDVSNVGYIELNVAINTQGAGNIAGQTVAINPPSGTLPSSYIVFTATSSSGTNIPVNAIITSGLGGTGGYQITFFLPEDSAIRTMKEQNFINTVKATDTGSSAASRAWLSSNNSQALAAVDRIYTQSRIGAFTLSVQYVSSQSGLWNGTIQSTLIIANVEYKGSFLDSLH